MSSKSKYTTFVGNQPAAKISLFGKLFKGNEKQQPLFFWETKEADAREIALRLGNSKLRAGENHGLQDADSGMFPKGVDLTFAGREATIQPPDTSKIVWGSPGDPANGYVPDVSSPGPGKTLGVDKTEDPKMSPDDFVAGLGGEKTTYTATENVASPDDKSVIYDANKLGASTELGHSSKSSK